METICRFIPSGRVPENIQVINFVYEAMPEDISYDKPNPVYKVHYVTAGTGKVKCGDEVKTVKKGDIFFVFPAARYGIFPDEDFEYMYISYVGIRANAEMERLGINRKNFVFEGYDELYDLWTGSVDLKNEIIDLASEGILLYTLSKIGVKTLYQESETSQLVSILNYSLLKKYVDDNFSDSELSLESLSVRFSYTKRYISTLFKKHFKIGFAEYLNVIRINHACTMIADGFTNVTLIAEKSGFSDALYFSRVFKQKVGVSPKKWILEMEKKKADM